MKFKILPTSGTEDHEPEITAQLYVDGDGDLGLRLNGKHAAYLVVGGRQAAAISNAIRDALAAL